jgi:hypothetical protein
MNKDRITRFATVGIALTGIWSGLAAKDNFVSSEELKKALNQNQSLMVDLYQVYSDVGTLNETIQRDSYPSKPSSPNLVTKPNVDIDAVIAEEAFIKIQNMGIDHPLFHVYTDFPFMMGYFSADPERDRERVDVYRRIRKTYEDIIESLVGNENFSPDNVDINTVKDDYSKEMSDMSEGTIGSNLRSLAESLSLSGIHDIDAMTTMKFKFGEVYKYLSGNLPTAEQADSAWGTDRDFLVTNLNDIYDLVFTVKTENDQINQTLDKTIYLLQRYQDLLNRDYASDEVTAVAELLVAITTGITSFALWKSQLNSAINQDQEQKKNDEDKVFEIDDSDERLTLEEMLQEEKRKNKTK